MQTSPPPLRPPPPHLSHRPLLPHQPRLDPLPRLPPLLLPPSPTPPPTNPPPRITDAARRVRERLQNAGVGKEQAGGADMGGLVLHLPYEYQFISPHQLPAFLTRPHPIVEPSPSAPAPLALVAPPSLHFHAKCQFTFPNNALRDDTSAPPPPPHTHPPNPSSPTCSVLTLHPLPSSLCRAMVDVEREEQPDAVNLAPTPPQSHTHPLPAPPLPPPPSHLLPLRLLPLHPRCPDSPHLPALPLHSPLLPLPPLPLRFPPGPRCLPPGPPSIDAALRAIAPVVTRQGCGAGSGDGRGRRG